MSNQEMQDAIAKLKREVADLTQKYYANNFLSRQDFNKYCAFNTALKVPHYSSAPATTNVGEIIEVAGILYISTAVNTFTKVGGQ